MRGPGGAPVMASADRRGVLDEAVFSGDLLLYPYGLPGHLRGVGGRSPYVDSYQELPGSVLRVAKDMRRIAQREIAGAQMPGPGVAKIGRTDGVSVVVEGALFN